MQKTKYSHVICLCDKDNKALFSLLKKKHLSYTQIDIEDLDVTYLKVLELIRNLHKHPQFVDEGIFILCFEQANQLAAPLQIVTEAKILLINPLTRVYFGNELITLSTSSQEQTIQQLTYYFQTGQVLDR